MGGPVRPSPSAGFGGIPPHGGIVAVGVQNSAFVPDAVVWLSLIMTRLPLSFPCSSTDALCIASCLGRGVPPPAAMPTGPCSAAGHLPVIQQRTTHQLGVCLKPQNTRVTYCTSSRNPPPHSRLIPPSTISPRFRQQAKRIHNMLNWWLQAPHSSLPFSTAALQVSRFTPSTCIISRTSAGKKIQHSYGVRVRAGAAQRGCITDVFTSFTHARVTTDLNQVCRRRRTQGGTGVMRREEGTSEGTADAGAAESICARGLATSTMLLAEL
ncbi:hypothetical protein C8F04DRAFT_1193117 [Mycena alexandri]|uniref:Uncharacterized protein n=1 Tax=Mycena alexandri TaxID=1745969 RepID=A0AAD6WUF0_9AGAR|nr:hypothetical protein C8F04DRAFT_1193117 [Mycena alexandri]